MQVFKECLSPSRCLIMQVTCGLMSILVVCFIVSWIWRYWSNLLKLIICYWYFIFWISHFTHGPMIYGKGVGLKRLVLHLSPFEICKRSQIVLVSFACHMLFIINTMNTSPFHKIVALQLILVWFKHFICFRWAVPANIQHTVNISSCPSFNVFLTKRAHLFLAESPPEPTLSESLSFLSFFTLSLALASSPFPPFSLPISHTDPWRAQQRIFFENMHL